MGETFFIANIDKGVCIGSLGTFGEFFEECARLAELVASAGIEFPKDPLEGQPYTEARKYKSSQYVYS